MKSAGDAHVIRCVNVTPPEVFAQQRGASRSSECHKVKKKDRRLTRATPSLQTLGISEGTGHTAGRADVWSLCAQDPDPRGWAETHTNPSTWGHTSTVSKMTPPPQILHLVPRPVGRTWCLCCLGPEGGNKWVPVTS